MLNIGKHAPLLDLAQTLLRSWWTLVAAVCLGLTGATFAIDLMPEKYQATTTVWISQQQLPESVARSTVNEDMTRRLMVFKAAVLGPEYMNELIARTFGLPETEEELRDLMHTLRSRVSVENIITVRRQGFATFGLTYRGDDDPRRAAHVINTLTQLYISQNAEFRSKRAEKTAETITGMSAKLKPELDEIDQKIARFRAAHRFETEADLPQNQMFLETAVRELELLGTKRLMLDTRAQTLDVQITQAEMRSFVPTETPIPQGRTTIDPRARQIAGLQRELDELRIHYSERHPSYLKKKRELEELLAPANSPEPAEDGESPDSGGAVDPAVAALQFQLEMTYAEMETLDDEEERLARDIAKFRRRIAAAPGVQIQLNELTERQNYLRTKRRELQSQADAAGGSVDLEEEELLGKRMEVLESASIPTSPYSPQPLRIYAVGIALGCLLFIGPLLARNILNPVILSEEGFRALSNSPVLVSIPSFAGSRSVATRRLVKNLTLSVLSGAVLVAAKLFFIP